MVFESIKTTARSHRPAHLVLQALPSGTGRDSSSYNRGRRCKTEASISAGYKNVWQPKIHAEPCTRKRHARADACALYYGTCQDSNATRFGGLSDMFRKRLLLEANGCQPESIQKSVWGLSEIFLLLNTQKKPVRVHNVALPSSCGVYMEHSIQHRLSYACPTLDNRADPVDTSKGPEIFIASASSAPH
jgi:hypothetical protein